MGFNWEFKGLDCNVAAYSHDEHCYFLYFMAQSEEKKYG
jgi:hypothetical protein